MSKSTTIDYYEKHADTYFETTYTVDMSPACDRFLKYIPIGGRIIDIGCGSGRDLKYFHDRDFSVEGLDASRALCEKAEMHTGIPVSCMRVQDWKPQRKYQGIWCCASILHLTKEEIFSFLQRIPMVLEPDGVIFISAKCGINTGRDTQGRYFTDFSEEFIDEISDKMPELVLEEQWYTADKLGRINVKWVNLIYRKPVNAEFVSNSDVHGKKMGSDEETNQETDQETKLKARTNQETDGENDENIEYSGETGEENDGNIEYGGETDEEKCPGEKILDLIKQRPDITQMQLAERTGLSYSGVRYVMTQLQKDGILERVGSTKKGQWIIKV